MLDPTNREPPLPTGAEERSLATESWRDGIGFSIFSAKLRQRRPTLLRLMLIGALTGWLGGIAYNLVRIPTFSASSELLISNTTLQMSGPDAVVTQVIVENSLIQSAIEMLKSTRVLDRVIDGMGLETIEQILPKSTLERAIEAAGWAKAREPGSSSEEERRQAALAKLRSNTSVSRVGASLVISVGVKALSAGDAVRLTNEMAGALVQEQNDTSAVVSTSAALRERIKVLGPTARIISYAVSPRSKDGLATTVMLLLASVIGGALGVGAGLALTLFDQRVRSAEQLVAATSLECFGYLPQLKFPRGRRAGLAGLLRRSVLRRARAAVLERSGRTPRFVGVTSRHCTEGKTTLAASWARFLAQDGARVLFVDATRDPAASSRSNGTGKLQGLHELLRGEAFADDVIQAAVSPNLDLLASGNASGNLDVLWGNFGGAIGAARECVYEWVIFDLPTLATAADVRSAGQIIDDLLVVVEWGRTSEAELKEALRSLGPVRDRIVGTVINKAPWTSLESEALVQALAARHASAGGDLKRVVGEGLS